MTVVCAAGLHWEVCGVLEERTLKMECWEAVNRKDCDRRIRACKSGMKMNSIRWPRENGLTRSPGRRDF